MDKAQSRAAARAFMRSPHARFPIFDDDVARTARERRTPPVDKARARQACAPMGTLLSVVVTTNAHKRRRTWYIIDPDVAMSAQYAAAGFDLKPGCKVLVDADMMRPVALLDVDPAGEAPDIAPMPHGFNPYFDVPAG
jgi:hypothetical protein